MIYSYIKPMETLKIIPIWLMTIKKMFSVGVRVFEIIKVDDLYLEAPTLQRHCSTRTTFTSGLQYYP